MNTVFCLRVWKDDDINALVSALNNKKISNNLRDTLPQPYTIEDAMMWVEKNKALHPNQNFAIEMNDVDVDVDVAVGAIGIVLKEDVHRMTAELGYWLDEKYWNRGIATAAVKQMVDYTFKTFPVHTIFSCVFEHNKASMRVLVKSGFKLDAVKKNGVIKNETVMDEYIFSIQKIQYPFTGSLI